MSRFVRPTLQNQKVLNLLSRWSEGKCLSSFAAFIKRDAFPLCLCSFDCGLLSLVSWASLCRCASEGECLPIGPIAAVHSIKRIRIKSSFFLFPRQIKPTWVSSIWHSCYYSVEGTLLLVPPGRASPRPSSCHWTGLTFNISARRSHRRTKPSMVWVGGEIF